MRRTAPARRPRPPSPLDRGAAALDVAIAALLTLVLGAGVVPVLPVLGEDVSIGLCRIAAEVVPQGQECAAVGAAVDDRRSVAGAVAGAGAGRARPPADVAGDQVRECLRGGGDLVQGLASGSREVLAQLLSTRLEIRPAGQALAPAWRDLQEFVRNPFGVRQARNHPARWLCETLLSLVAADGAGRLVTTSGRVLGRGRVAPGNLLVELCDREAACVRGAGQGPRPGGAVPTVAELSAGLGEGRFTLGRRLGSGYFGNVYVLEGAGPSDLVVKLYKPRGTVDAAIRSLTNEVAAVRRLEAAGIRTAHPRLVTWRYASTGEEQVAVVMDRLDGVHSKSLFGDVDELSSTRPPTSSGASTGRVVDPGPGIVNARTVSSLQHLRDALRSHRLEITDLQGMFVPGGEFVVLDPYTVSPLPSSVAASTANVERLLGRVQGLIGRREAR